MVERPNGKLRKSVRNAVVQLSEAPCVRGFSPEGGLEPELLDTSNCQLSMQALVPHARAYIAAANATCAFV